MRALILVGVIACGSSSDPAPSSVRPDPSVRPERSASEASAKSKDGFQLAQCIPAPIRPGAFDRGWGAHSGYGGPRRLPDDDSPRVTLSAVTADGDLDPIVIRRYLKRKLAHLQYCYEKQLLAKPTITGTMSPAIAITATGATSAVTNTTGVDDDVASCVADVLRSIEYPKPKGGAAVTAHVTIAFENGDPDSPPRPRPYGTPWLPMRLNAEDDPKVEAALADAAKAALAPRLASLDACVRPHEQRGTFRAMIVVAGDGSTELHVGGLDERVAEPCVEKALAGLTVAGPKDHVPVTIACDLIHEEAQPLRITDTPAYGYVSLSHRAITYEGHLESTYPAGVPYLIVSSFEVTGEDLGRALAKTARGSVVILADTERNTYLGMVAGHGDLGRAARIVVGRDHASWCLDGKVIEADTRGDRAKTRDFATRIADACDKDGCDHAAVLALDPDGTVGDLTAMVEELRAHLPRIAFTRELSCR
ncbi:MAG TPA: AgmX/PglI C-terminal domain-containing protein [Kofleriaceae bacterium]|nr:AgmX/PglI C-terminal domain-containing protein [Kofleriaceae bacterium]